MNCIRCDIPETTLSANGYCEHCFDLQDNVQELIEAARKAWREYSTNLNSYSLRTAYGRAVAELMEQTGWGIQKTSRIINEVICA